MSSWVRGLFGTGNSSSNTSSAPPPATAQQHQHASTQPHQDQNDRQENAGPTQFDIAVREIVSPSSGTQSLELPSTTVGPIPVVGEDKPKDFNRLVEEAKEYTMSHPIIIGAGLAAAAFAARVGIRAVQRYRNLPAGIGPGGKKFYKGGFDPKMNAKEALLILGLTESSLSRAKLKEAHRRIMLLNHPDRGGSPYVATKINEAKDFLEKRGRLRP
ncbi:hypothetical protein POJ06DRAFT_143422 [Lipomyces tetrasporus]|uniref:Mitochondrial import inner membrane translocase subunit TIM14 n=1 Tax=Lipomyces tetrasporus TaxID=54092 RepID=A0AAD7QS93_9ASCO|nr:uncharacterized protein POJ06DRAFT_143422 [Lipomyces tetrasporus]KAJ8098852.1 hypothetical protein POJ06DRAFT_143422 [Lipomyces tetrasporus]